MPATSPRPPGSFGNPTKRGKNGLSQLKRRFPRDSRMSRIGMALLSTMVLIGVEEIIRFHSSDAIPGQVGLMRDEEWKVRPHSSNQSNVTVSMEEAEVRHQQAQVSNRKTDTISEEAEETPKGDKSLILNILKVAGMTELPEESVKELPTTETLESMYGKVDEPIVYGLDTCQKYRDSVPLKDRITAPAGMFNTGTNALEVALRRNIQKITTVWQVPWGKHRTASRRLSHRAPGLEKYNQTAVLPVVIIRDPYSWMQSMCKNAYAAKWPHHAQRCPNLVPSPSDFKKFRSKLHGNETTFQVKVNFDDKDVQYWDSLAHLWGRWYHEYFAADYPRIMIRFEDLLLHSDDLMEIIADCLGTNTTGNHYIQTKASKGHGSGADFLKAVLKTGNRSLREQKFSKPDLRFAKEALDSDLIRVFNYQLIEPKQ